MIKIGLTLIAVAGAFAFWGYTEQAAVHRAGISFYDNPLPSLGMYLFGWPGLVLSGIGLIARIAGAACIALAMAAILQFVW